MGRALAFRITTGQAHELLAVILLLDGLPGMSAWVLAERGYSSRTFREYIWNLRAGPEIPPRRHEAPFTCPGSSHYTRSVVERLWARLKEWRAVASCYEKTAASFIGVVCLAVALDWLKR